MCYAGSRIVLLGFVVAYVGGCGANSPHPKVAQAPNAVPAPDGPPAAVERKIIYTSHIEVIVDELAAAQQKMTQLVKSIEDAGGYLSHQEVSGQQGYRRHGSWTVRVPLSKFDGFVADVEVLGELRRHSREAQDVTEAYADLEARLRNKQASEARLLSHLQKTGELKDTLEVERELSRVRGEVEQLQGQLNLMKNKTDLATVYVTLYERDSQTPLTSPNFTSQISRTFSTSWQGLVMFGKLVVLAAVSIVPWLIPAAILLGLILVVRGMKRKPLAK